MDSTTISNIFQVRAPGPRRSTYEVCITQLYVIHVLYIIQICILQVSDDSPRLPVGPTKRIYLEAFGGSYEQMELYTTFKKLRLTKLQGDTILRVLTSPLPNGETFKLENIHHHRIQNMDACLDKFFGAPDLLTADLSMTIDGDQDVTFYYRDVLEVMKEWWEVIQGLHPVTLNYVFCIHVLSMYNT